MIPRCTNSETDRRIVLKGKSKRFTTNRNLADQFKI